MDFLVSSTDFCVHVAFWTVVHSLWQGTIFAGALATWRSFAASTDPGARSAAATLTLLFLAAAPIVTATSLALAYEVPAASPLEQEFDVLSLTIDRHATIAFAENEPEPTTFRRLIENSTVWLPHAVAMLWAIGVTWGAARLCASAARLRLVRKRSANADEALAKRCRELARRGGLGHAPQVLRSLSARAPYAFGLLRPCIVVPAAWALETAPDVLEAAIAHELAHLKRRDLWGLALQRLVETTLFFHPGVWYVSGTLNADRERAADRLAAEILGDRARYAESLCRLASLTVGPDSPALTLPFHGETRMKLLERVRHVLRTEEAKSGGISSVGWLCLAPALLAAIFVGQAAFAGRLTADEGERDRPSATKEVDEEEADADEKEARRDRPAKPDQRKEEVAEEKRDDDREGDDDRERDAAEGPFADLRHQFAEEKARLEEAVRKEAQALEQQYKEQMAAAQERMAAAMQKLQAAAQSRTKELEKKFAEAAAKRQAEGERRPDEKPREGVRDDEADDLTPRERRMLGVIRSLEARLQELESRLPRDGEHRKEGDRPREERPETDRPKEEARDRDRPREEDRPQKEAPKDEDARASERIQLRSGDQAQERQFQQFSERLYAALRSDDLADERRAEFARRAVLDAFGYELNPEQVQVVLERSRGDLAGFRQLLTRLSQARKE